ncbi:MAG: hypothetical protein ACTSVI_08165 [Promethearchaeota archaeon]
MKEDKQEQLESVNPSSISLFLDKESIKQGFYLSIPIQFLFITMPFLVWKIKDYPGIENGYLDLVAIIVLSVLIVVTIGIVGGIFFKKRKDGKIAVAEESSKRSGFLSKIRIKDEFHKHYLNALRSFLVISNLVAFCLILMTLSSGMRFSLNLSGTLNMNALLPSIMLSVFLGLNLVGCVMILLGAKLEKNRFAAISGWASIFLSISLLSGIIAVQAYILPSPIYLSFISQVVMTGFAGIMFKRSDLMLASSRKDIKIEARLNCPAVEIKGFNTTAFVVLIGTLLFHFSTPLFTSSEIMRNNEVFLILIPVIVGAVVGVLSNKMADETLKARLIASMAFNFLCLAIGSAFSLESLEWAFLKSILLGAGLGLALEPIFRSLMKARYQQRGFCHLLNFSWVTMILSGVFITVSAILVYYEDSLDPYIRLISFLSTIILTIPILFSLNYDPKFSFNNKRPVNWIIYILALIGIMGLMGMGVYLTLF